MIGYEVQGDTLVIEPQLRHIEALMLLGARVAAPGGTQWALPNSRQARSALDTLFQVTTQDTVDTLPSAAPIDAEDHLRTATDLPEIPGRTKSWLHQKQAYWWALPKKAAYVAAWMGTGKSKLAVALSEGGDHRRTLIVCPKKVVPGWANQFAVHGTEGRDPVIATLVKGSVLKRVEQATQALALADRLNRPAVVVLNYEAIPSVAMQKYLKKAGFTFVVLDEAVKIKAPQGLTSKTLWRIFRGQPIRRLALSGTPFPHSPLDAFGQYRFLDESIFGTVWTRFRLRYAEYGVPALPQMVTAHINQDELAVKMAPILFQVGRDVLDLPPVLHVERRIDLSPKAASLYRTLEKDFYAEIETGEVTAANVLTRLLRLQQITSGFVTQDSGEQIDIDTGKREMLDEVLGELPTHEPVVVFARFHHDLDAIRAVAESQGRRYGEVSGRRDDLVASKFPPDVDVLGVQMQSGGAGIDLSRAAYGVYWSLSFSLGDFDQSIARLDRPTADGTKRSGPVTFMHLIANNSVDDSIYRALEARRDVVQAVMERM